MIKLNIIANYIGQAWVTLLGILFIPYYIKILGVEAYGVISFITSLQILLTVLDLGITISLNREFSKFNYSNGFRFELGELLRSVEALFFCISALVVLGFFLASMVSNNIFETEQYTVGQMRGFLNVAGFLVALRLIEGIYKSCLVGMQMQIKVNALNVLMSTFRHFGAIGILVALDSTVEVYLFWQVFISIITVIIFGINVYRSLSLGFLQSKFSIIYLTKTFNFAFGVMAMSVLSLFLTSVDKLFLVKFVSLKEYSEYMLAMTLAAGLNSFVGPIVQATFPRLCQLREDKSVSQYGAVFHMASQLTCVLVSSVGAVIFFNADEIMLLWTQDDALVTTVAPLLKIIVLGTILNCLTWMPFQALLSYGLSGYVAKINLVSLFFVLPVFYFLVDLFGVKGAAYTWLFYNLVYFIFGSYFAINRSVRFEFQTWLFSDTLFPLMGSFGLTAILVYFNIFDLVDYWDIINYLCFSFFFALLGAVIFANNFRYYLYFGLLLSWKKFFSIFVRSR